MHPWARIRRLLALAVTVLFMLTTLVSPVFAGSRGFSAPRSSSFGSSSRSFSTPKVSTPSSPSRSFSSPKASTGTSSSRAYSSPSPTSSSSSAKGYSTPTSPSYSSGNRSYSSDSRSYSSQRSTTAPAGSTSTTPPVSPSYEVGRTRYPSLPPVVIIGSSPYDPGYWHDYYYGRPWWWRTWHRPVYYSDTGFAISWVAVVGSAMGIWILFGIISAIVSRRRR